MPKQPKKPPRPAPIVVERHSPTKVSWPPRLARLLGTVPDHRLAAKAGVHPHTVKEERERRGVPPFRYRQPNVVWSAEMISRLGTASDRRVAVELGLCHASVCRKRLQLNIPSYAPPPHDKSGGHRWTRREIALLGKHTDREVAEALGINLAAVILKRQRLNIPPSKPPALKVRWTKRRIALLGRHPDPVVAAKLGISPSSVKRKRQQLGIAATHEPRAVVRSARLKPLLRLPPSVARQQSGLKYDTLAKLRRELGVRASTVNELRWPPSAVRLLGTDRDVVIAARLGVPETRVAWKRRALGIPGWSPRARWQPHEVARLGQASDKKVAAELGRSPQTVAFKRRALGIPVFTPRPRRKR